MKPTSVRKDDLIQIRASAAVKVVLNRAATLRGQKLSEFMLDSAPIYWRMRYAAVWLRQKLPAREQ